MKLSTEVNNSGFFVKLGTLPSLVRLYVNACPVTGSKYQLFFADLPQPWLLFPIATSYGDACISPVFSLTVLILFIDLS